MTSTPTVNRDFHCSISSSVTLAPSGRSWQRGKMSPASASRASHAASTSTVSASARLSTEAPILSHQEVPRSSSAHAFEISSIESMPSPSVSNWRTSASTCASVRAMPPGTGLHMMALSSSGESSPSPLVSYSAKAARMSAWLGPPPRSRPRSSSRSPGPTPSAASVVAAPSSSGLPPAATR